MLEMQVVAGDDLTPNVPQAPACHPPSNALPAHGWIGCTRCYAGDETSRLVGLGTPPPLKIEQPNGAWGASDPLVIVLDFAQGVGRADLEFDSLAFPGVRSQLTRIMQGLGLLGATEHVDQRIHAGEKDFHFASMVRCGASMWDDKKKDYAASGNAALPRFLGNARARQVAQNCTDQFLAVFPPRTKLVLLLGNTPEFIEGCKRLLMRIFPAMEHVNDLAYTNGAVTFVHTIHAAAQGSYLGQWLAGSDTAIGRKLAPAREAVAESGVLGLLQPGSSEPATT